MRVQQKDGLIAAAQYVRMSTDMQEHSIENQIAAIGQYAAARGYKIIDTYCDAGKSGLRAENRGAMQKLLSDVQSGKAPFRAILVYDVSRWGRFQDADEAAFHEFECKRAGIAVRYCAEPFETMTAPLSAVMKGMKRAMAGEYSRELSVKVFAGQKRVVEGGFRLGAAGYGLRRAVVNESGKVVRVLEAGEHKYLRSDHTILVPGPSEEVREVRAIFHHFLNEKMGPTAIARRLNEHRGRTGRGRHWDDAKVSKILSGPRYAGLNVWNRRSSKIGGRPTNNPPDQWVYGSKPFTPLVDRATFDKAQRMLAAMKVGMSDEVALDKLRALLDKEGLLGATLIEATKDLPSVSVYVRRFGSLREAYRRIGYDPRAVTAQLQALQAETVAKVIRLLAARGVTAAMKASGLTTLRLEGGAALHVIMMRNGFGRKGFRWRLHLHHAATPGFALAIRPDRRTRRVAAYYFFSTEAFRRLPALQYNEKDLKALEAYRLKSLSSLARKHVLPSSDPA